jgi:ArsR family transcriptional regulator, virulence genes transcriptional regulator
VKDQLIAESGRATSFLKALSGQSRLLLLCHLWDGEKSVGELARLTAARDTAVSQQLAVLRRRGMVNARRSGQTIYYSLSSDEVERTLELMVSLFCAKGSGQPS